MDMAAWAAILALSIIGIFLTLDAALALVFGKRYVLWGLEYAPRAYSDLIHGIAALPAARLLMIKALELLAGLAFLLAATCLVFFTP